LKLIVRQQITIQVRGELNESSGQLDANPLFAYDVSIYTLLTSPLMKIPSPNKAREIKNAFEQKKTDLANKQREELRLEKKKKIEVGKICREIIQNAFQASLKGQPYLLVAPTDIGSDHPSHVSFCIHSPRQHSENAVGVTHACV
jgi:hypothetical protein